MNKYHNKKIMVDGVLFDSKKEYKRYLDLKLLEKAGRIKDLERQVSFELQPAFTLNNKKFQKITYIADFVYFDNDKNKQIVEDVKGFKTKDYNLKKKLFAYKYGFEIEEI